MVLGIKRTAIDLDEAVHILGGQLGGAGNLDGISHDGVGHVWDTVLVQVLTQGCLVDAAHRAIVFPANLVFVVIIAHNQTTAIQIDRLSHRILIVKAAAVDGNLDTAGLVLDSEVFVAVAALVGADHGGLDDEDIIVAADRVLRA